ncbi:caspase family protein [Desertibaculum subflavum]|uniref:caspase family protein n=1 Tax=Desertibaculum subflavum TaxID=2268458 RepID=UPI000E670AF3
MAKKAICVGINDYPGSGNDLNGCLNDCDDWAALLRDGFSFDAVDQIKDRAATMAAMTGALERLVTKARPDDVLVFTYSGHGTWVPDDPDNPDEADNRDEALCAHDGIILDDQIREIISRLTPGARLTVISDSCHSGSVTRALLRHAANSARSGMEAQRQARPRFMPPSDDMLARRARGLPVRRRAFYPETGMSELLITGCNSLEYSYDAHLNGRFNGAMTANAIQIIKSDPTLTYANFHKQLRQLLPSNQFPQSPQLEGPDSMKSRRLFT